MTVATGGSSSRLSVYTFSSARDPGAGALSWTGSYPSSTTALTASWIASTHPNISNQKIQFYSDEFCNVTTGALIDLASTVVQTRAFTGAAGSNATRTESSLTILAKTPFGPSARRLNQLLRALSTLPRMLLRLGWAMAVVVKHQSSY